MIKKVNWLPILLISLLAYAVWLLGSMLLPFIIAGYLAYLGNPFVHTLMRYRLPRTVAVICVFVLLIFLIVGFWLLLIPILKHELDVFVAQLPTILSWLEITLAPWWQKLAEFLPGLKLPSIKDLILNNLPATSHLASQVWMTASKSWSTLIDILMNLLLIPVVTFYFLRDWDELLESQRYWVDRTMTKHRVVLITEVDQILRKFFQGQLTVMFVLGFAYAVALYFLGIPLSFLIGVIVGLLSLVPFLGFIVGVLLASIMALLQFHDVIYVVYVWGIFVGLSLFENMILVPWLVGDSLGLHPVAVIFALLAGGQLFGVLGVLLALPIAAVVKVSLHHFFINRELVANAQTTDT